MTIPLIILNGIIPETMITLRLFAISAKVKYHTVQKVIKQK